MRANARNKKQFKRLIIDNIINKMPDK